MRMLIVGRLFEPSSGTMMRPFVAGYRDGEAAIGFADNVYEDPEQRSCAVAWRAKVLQHRIAEPKPRNEACSGQRHSNGTLMRHRVRFATAKAATWAERGELSLTRWTTSSPRSISCLCRFPNGPKCSAPNASPALWSTASPITPTGHGLFMSDTIADAQGYTLQYCSVC
jgi:hypothetical protein